GRENPLDFWLLTSDSWLPASLSHHRIFLSTPRPRLVDGKGDARRSSRVGRMAFLPRRRDPTADASETGRVEGVCSFIALSTGERPVAGLGAGLWAVGRGPPGASLLASS